MPRVAILGATGAVGDVLRRVLAEREFPVDDLVCLASPRSAGTTYRWTCSGVASTHTL